jgi:hypothetical protein
MLFKDFLPAFACERGLVSMEHFLEDYECVAFQLYVFRSPSLCNDCFVARMYVWEQYSEGWELSLESHH